MIRYEIHIDKSKKPDQIIEVNKARFIRTKEWLDDAAFLNEDGFYILKTGRIKLHKIN